MDDGDYIPDVRAPRGRKITSKKNTWEATGWTPSELDFSRPNHISIRPFQGQVSATCLFML